MPEDDEAAARPSFCNFLGVQLLRVGDEAPRLRAIVGRNHQCGLYSGHYRLCVMVGEGKAADWEKCPCNPWNQEPLLFPK